MTTLPPRRAFLVALIIAAAVAVPPATGARAADPAWTVDPLPNVRLAAPLAAAAALDARHAWAVGQERLGIYAPGVPLVLAWNGTAWRKVALPEVTWQGRLTGVAADGPRDVVAVGVDVAGNGHTVHYDGTGWHDVPGPVVAHVSARAGAPPWGVGPAPTNDGVYRWNGAGWEQQGVAVGTALRVVGPDDVWLATEFQVAGPCCASTIAVSHWDGAAWTTLPVVPGAFNTGVDLYVGGADDIWVTGTTQVPGRPPICPTGSCTTGLLTHWDGTAWTSAPANGISLSGSDTGAVEWLATGTDGLWRYDAGSWTLTPSAATPGGTVTLVAVAHVPGTATTLAVGARTVNQTAVPLVERTTD